MTTEGATDYLVSKHDARIGVGLSICVHTLLHNYIVTMMKNSIVMMVFVIHNNNNYYNNIPQRIHVSRTSRTKSNGLLVTTVCPYTLTLARFLKNSHCSGMHVSINRPNPSLTVTSLPWSSYQ